MHTDVSTKCCWNKTTQDRKELVNDVEIQKTNNSGLMYMIAIANTQLGASLDVS
jgi:hypothetical protein